jgi:hypothetical protein
MKLALSSWRCAKCLRAKYSVKCSLSRKYILELLKNNLFLVKIEGISYKDNPKNSHDGDLHNPFHQ